MMSDQNVNILFIGDIIGSGGLDTVATVLPKLMQQKNIDLVIANGENATQGRGLDDKTIKRLQKTGIQIITSGNHIWQRRKYLQLLDTDPYVLRPLNYPSGCPGHGSCIYETQKNVKVGVINVQGRSFMYPIDCPFRSVYNEIEILKKQGICCILLDFHAEATAEKVALGYFLDGQVSAVIGTHTHVQTADERILPKGTAYITDAGMTGAQNSVIGMNIETAIKRFVNQMPEYYLIASPVDLACCAVYIQIDTNSGFALKIERLQLKI